MKNETVETVETVGERGKVLIMSELDRSVSRVSESHGKTKVQIVQKVQSEIMGYRLPVMGYGGVKRTKLQYK